MINPLVSHPTVVSSSRLILPHVETVLRHGKCVLLLKVVGGELVVVVDEYPLPPELAGGKHAVPSATAVGGCIPTSAKAGCG